METPRPVPPYDAKSVHSIWWYCLYCKHSNPIESSLKTHIRMQHFAGDSDYSPGKGDDYTNGDHLRVLIRRWEEWSLLAVDRFALQLESLRGADDFELEVGDGLPE